MPLFRVIIPVRYASSRLPGKPLLMFNDKPIIEHVYNNARESNAESVLIATDDQRIADAAKEFGADVCMTSGKHQSGTDRIAEAVQIYGWEDDQIIVNVQGDEPQMSAANIRQVATLLEQNSQAAIATLCVRLYTRHEYEDPNIVKVVKDRKGRALYFSRSSIPHLNDVNPKTLSKHPVYRHVGIYSYRVDYLKNFVQMPQSELEKEESLEQLRAMEAGDTLVAEECIEKPGIGVDTMEDYHRLKVNRP